jgi:NTP pyrophosphatase (non-canonical NTP hydrolase)
LQIDLQKYTQFVDAVTSGISNDTAKLVARLQQLQENVPDLNVALAQTAAVGLCGEAGEFSEIFKKVIFHDKPFTEETRTHCAKELGDVIWYWVNACRALNLDPNQVIADNVTKLEARYPGGTFSAAMSDNRAVGDI